ncbi:carbohydrate-binding protein [Butyrivibrio sp. MC2013]|uniref:carbohydrate-binding protein n=1 Tax=Butyrivibrio sp. MC2013 TaxID=1280686 RepID=UPI00041F79FD|nr:carbohydrate-binding protein [Butyrivibrio sp. MC2013]
MGVKVQKRGRKTYKRMCSFAMAVSLAAGAMPAALPAVTVFAKGGDGVSMNESNAFLIEAEDHSSSQGGKKLEDGNAYSGSGYIGDFFVGNSLTFNLAGIAAGSYELLVRVGTEQAGGSFDVLTGDEVIASGSFDSTGGWQNYIEVSVPIELSEDISSITIRNTRNTWNIDRITLIGAGSRVSSDLDLMIEAEDYISGSGQFKILYDGSASSGAHLGDFDAGDSASYGFFAQNSGRYRFTFLAGSERDDAAANVYLDGHAYDISLNRTGGWQTYKPMSFTAEVDSGYHFLTVEDTKGTWNFDTLTVSFVDESLVTYVDPKEDTIISPSFVSDYAGIVINEDGDSDSGYCIDDIDAGDYVTYLLSSDIKAPYEIRLLTKAGGDIYRAAYLSVAGEEKPVSIYSGSDGYTLSDPVYISLREGEQMLRIRASEGDWKLGAIVVKGTDEEVEDDLAEITRDAYIKTSDGWKKAVETSSIASKDNSISFSFDQERSVRKLVLSGLNVSADVSAKVIVRNSGGVTETPAAVSVNDETGEVTFMLPGGIWSDSFELLLDTELSVSCDQLRIYENTDLAAPEKDTSAVLFQNVWKRNEYLSVNSEGRIVYNASGRENADDNCVWDLEKKGEYYTLKNAASGKYAGIDENGTAVCISDTADSLNEQWKVRDMGSDKRFENAADSSRVLQVEAQDGLVYTDYVPDHYQSAMWNVENSSYGYTLEENRAYGPDWRVIANSGSKITSNREGKDNTWKLSEDISFSPVFKAPNTPLAEAVYNLSMEEAYLNMFQGNNGTVFRTGTDWPKVWTRDTAMSCEYSLAALFPEISRNCALEKVVGEEGSLTFEQDTGTGGSYPVSDDKIITMLSVWEIYLATGDTAILDDFYDIAENTIAQDLHVCFDSEAGLFRGETGGLDHRDKTYPDWMSETYKESLANIAESKPAVVNIIYCEVFDIMSEAARILGKDADTVQKWAELRDNLKKTVEERLWSEDLGIYSSWEYPEYMGSPLAYKSDVISNGYALLFDIGSAEQLQKIAENYPLVTFGAPTVYPQKNGRQGGTIYHNRGVWPGWEAVLMLGADHAGNRALASEIWDSCIYGASALLTNREVIDFTTGAPGYSKRQLWSIAGTLAGYLKVLYGMEYTTDGVKFHPFVPDWMEGPFELTGLKYRNASLNLKLEGKGDTIRSIKVNGQEFSSDYILPGDVTGTVNIEILVDGKSDASSYNLNDDKNHVTCPDLPELIYENGELKWAEKAGLSYKLWTGREYISVSGGSYRPDTSVYGAYSLVAVNADGISSEMSRPVVLNDPSNMITLEAEDGSYADGSFASSKSGYTGRGYVKDPRASSAPVTVTADLDKDGVYLLSSIYNNVGDTTTGDACAIRSVYVDGKDVGSLVFPVMGFNYQESTHLTLRLEKGRHEIKVLYDNDNWYDRNMNKAKNDVEYDSFILERIADYTPEITDPDQPGTEDPGTDVPSEPTEPDQPGTEDPGTDVPSEPTEPDQPGTDDPGTDTPSDDQYGEPVAVDTKAELEKGEFRRLHATDSTLWVPGVEWTLTANWTKRPDRYVVLKGGVAAAVQVTPAGKVLTATATKDGKILTTVQITVKDTKPKYKKAGLLTTGGILVTDTVELSLGKEPNDYVTVAGALGLTGASIKAEVYGSAVTVKHSGSLLGLIHTFKLSAKEPGTAYIVWTATKGRKTSQTLTKVIITKPLLGSEISVEGPNVTKTDKGYELEVVNGKEEQLKIVLPADYTDLKDLTFKASGSSVKVTADGTVSVPSKLKKGSYVTVSLGSAKVKVYITERN